MKKFSPVLICILLSVLLCLSLATCDNNNNSSDNSESTICSHTYNSATCLEPQTCTKCGVTKGSALGHTTSAGICSRCGVSLSKWKKRYYVDELNNQTDNAFIAPIEYFTGTFSNSETTNSELNVYIRVDEEDCQIMLYEYGEDLVKASWTTDYDVTVQLPDGTKQYFTGTMYQNGQVIHISDYTGMLILLKNIEGNLKIYIKENSIYGFNSTYLFTVETLGFKDLYNSTFS